MIHMRQPFHSIATAAVFLVFGVLFGGAAISQSGVTFADVTLNEQATWAATGLMFVMSYFSLVHLRYRD